jgi:hypothetical protein
MIIFLFLVVRTVHNTCLAFDVYFVDVIAIVIKENPIPNALSVAMVKFGTRLTVDSLSRYAKWRTNHGMFGGMYSRWYLICPKKIIVGVLWCCQCRGVEGNYKSYLNLFVKTSLILIWHRLSIWRIPCL